MPEETYTFRGKYIPSRMMPSLKRYVEQGIIPGHFLQAVIRDSLADALMYADDENIENIHAYAGFFFNKVPSDAWRSKEKMLAWNKRGGLAGPPINEGGA